MGTGLGWTVGVLVGADDGSPVGCAVGSRVEGEALGCSVGTVLGWTVGVVVGATVGIGIVGWDVDGTLVGDVLLGEAVWSGGGGFWDSPAALNAVTIEVEPPDCKTRVILSMTD